MALTVAELIQKVRTVGAAGLTPEEFRALSKLRLTRAVGGGKAAETHWLIPQGEWVRLAGVDRKTVLRHLAALGAPGNPIDLRVVIPALHRVLHARSEQKRRQKTGLTPLERFRSERAMIARMERLAMQRKLLPVAEVRTELARIADTLRAAAERIEDQYGRDAGDLLREVIDGMRRHAESRTAQASPH